MADFDVWRSRPLDVHRWSSHPKIKFFVDKVFNSMTEDQKRSLTGRSNNSGQASGRDHLKIILLDLYVAWKTDPELCLGLARANGAYSVNSRYNALHVSPRIRQVADVLEESGFLDVSGGSFNKSANTGHNRTSRIKPSAKLEVVFSELGFEPYELDLHHLQECIILTNDEPAHDGQNIRKQIEYEDTPEIVQMRDRLRYYNEFLNETYIDIPSLIDPWIIRKKGNGISQHIPIGQTNKFVRRIFSRGSWELNGRFYGGWWQQVDKHLRRDIVINNLPTVEIDYKGLHVAILSCLRGVKPSRDDRYRIKKHILTNFNLEKQRAILKLLVLTAINARDEKSAYKAFRSDQPKGTPEKKLKDAELSLLLESFIDENPHLRDDLCSDKGIMLMYLDSQITDGILTRFVNAEKPVLPVHDSYIVTTFDVDFLSSAMAKVSKDVVGYDLSVEQSQIGFPDLMRLAKQDRDTFLHYSQDFLVIGSKSPEYEGRLRRFVDFRSDNFDRTYWND